MGIFTKDIKTMDDLFLHQLEDIYYAELQLTKAIPKMADLATNADLKAGLKSHLIDTQKQIERLDAFHDQTRRHLTRFIQKL